MPRQRRGIRGDAPQGYLFRFAPLRGHRPLRTVCRKRMRIPPGGQSRPPLHPVSQRQMHYQNQTSGQRPPPTFAASRQRRDLIIALPRWVFPKREGRSPPSLVVSRKGDFQGGREIEIPSPLNGVLWILSFARERKYPAGGTKRKEKKKNVLGGAEPLPYARLKKAPRRRQNAKRKCFLRGPYSSCSVWRCVCPKRIAPLPYFSRMASTALSSFSCRWLRRAV